MTEKSKAGLYPASSASTRVGLNALTEGREDVRLQDIYRPLVLDADPRETLSDVATRMRENDVSSLAVIDDGQLVGIITERDVVTAVAERATSDTRIAAYMTLHPVTADPDESATAVVQRMLDLGVRHLPVVRSGAVVGMVSVRDLLALEIWPRASGAD
jgi:CBS domain-containing protein